LLNSLQVIIIDEVSMLRPDILDAMHWTLIKNGCKRLSAMQVIFVGDMAQLPPVLSDNDRSVLYRTYNGDDFTNAKVYSAIDPVTVNLEEVVRQTDEEFISHLNIIRDGGKSEYFKRFVSNDVDGIVLAPYNATVAKYNEEGLAQQKGDLFTFEASIEGDVKAEDFNLEATVRVKNGCKVMYLVNSKDNPLVNGTLGIFISHEGCHYIRVKGVDYALERVQFTKKEYVYDEAKDDLLLKEKGKIEQYPIKLAYALSIHKSQGLTFDNVTLDLTRPCFQKGQLYVALSRVTGPSGLKIKIAS
jgi:ATP-dependent DNA helicase PIF1